MTNTIKVNEEMILEYKDFAKIIQKLEDLNQSYANIGIHPKHPIRITFFSLLKKIEDYRADIRNIIISQVFAQDKHLNKISTDHLKDGSEISELFFEFKYYYENSDRNLKRGIYSYKTNQCLFGVYTIIEIFISDCFNYLASDLDRDELENELYNTITKDLKILDENTKLKKIVKNKHLSFNIKLKKIHSITNIKWEQYNENVLEILMHLRNSMHRNTKLSSEELFKHVFMGIKIEKPENFDEKRLSPLSDHGKGNLTIYNLLDKSIDYCNKLASNPRLNEKIPNNSISNYVF